MGPSGKQQQAESPKVFEDQGEDDPRTPPGHPQHPDWGSSPCPGPGGAWGTGRAAVPQDISICFSPALLLLKAGTSGRPNASKRTVRSCCPGQAPQRCQTAAELRRAAQPCPGDTVPQPGWCLSTHPAASSAEPCGESGLETAASVCAAAGAPARPGSPCKPPGPVIEPRSPDVGLPWVPRGPAHSPATLGIAQTHGGFEQQAPGRGSGRALTRINVMARGRSRCRL